MTEYGSKGRYQQRALMERMQDSQPTVGSAMAKDVAYLCDPVRVVSVRR